MKTCKKCNKQKPEAEFRERTYSTVKGDIKSYRVGECKECAKLYMSKKRLNANYVQKAYSYDRSLKYKDIKKYLWKGARSRARQFSILFTIKKRRHHSTYTLSTTKYRTKTMRW